jgi:hypothetical protein
VLVLETLGVHLPAAGSSEDRRCRGGSVGRISEAIVFGAVRLTGAYTVILMLTGILFSLFRQP